MATIPVKKSAVSNSTNMLNLMRSEGSDKMKSSTKPVTEGNVDTLRAMGGIIVSDKELRNEFLSWLVNRIAMVIITSKIFYNPWRSFKRGILEYGETVEEIFVELCKPHKYNPEVAEEQVERREIPDVRAVFHMLNYEYFYKSTIQYKSLHKAFLSFQGVSDLVSGIITKMYTSANYDEFLVSKYMVARAILNGDFYPVEIGNTTTKDGMLEAATVIKGISNSLTFMSDLYNPSAVHTSTDKSDQILIMTSKFDASMDVNVLASAFNMEKAEFMGNRVLVDSFADLDTKRLNELFKDSEFYTPLTSDEIEKLNAVPAVLIDKSWFMIFDNLIEMDERHNGEGLYWNYWLHVWKTFSYSPFSNAIVFTNNASAVDSVTVSPATATAGKNGSTILFKADVSGDGFPPDYVEWESSDPDSIDINEGGLATVLQTPASTVTITATSIFDSSKTGTATISAGN